MSLKVINLWAGPGAGKSTTAAHLFALMKARGHKVELLTEYAKECVYAGDEESLRDPLWIFANSARRLARLEGKVEWAILDSPLPLCLAYARAPWLEAAIREHFGRYDNRDFFIRRVKPYQTYGRRERTVDEARAKDAAVADVMLEFVGSNYVPTRHAIAGDEQAAETIYRSLFPQPPEAPHPALYCPSYQGYREAYRIPEYVVTTLKEAGLD